MAEWQTNGTDGDWKNRLVFQPINMATSGANLAQSETESPNSELNDSNQSLNDSNDDDSSNNTGVPIATTVPSTPIKLPVYQEGVTGAPDFQFIPYVLQGGRIACGAQNHSSAHTVPNNYGFGSWNAVYTGVPPPPIQFMSGENGYHSENGGQVSPPLMFSSSPPNVANLTLSPKSESARGAAVMKMVVDSVFSGGSPSSTTARRYLRLNSELNDSNQTLNDSNDDESSNNTGVPIATTVPSTPIKLPVYQEGVTGAPDFQFIPYVLQGGRIACGAQNHSSAHNVPNNYGFGSWNAVYTGIAPPPIQKMNRENGSVQGYHQPLVYMPFHNQPTPPSASLAGSPNHFFGAAFTNMNQMPITNMNPAYSNRSSHSVYNASSSNSTINSQYGGSNGLATRGRRGPDETRSSNRSHLLDDFRSNRANTLQLSDLVNHVVEFAKDQHGSRFIQQKLEKASAKEKQIVFEEVIGNAQALMTDVFGNYVIQKFFEYGTEPQKLALANAVRGNVMNLALQMYGCRVIQKALESIDEQGQMELLREMDGKVLQCVKDQNGNHVVQKIIEKVKPEKLQFIIDAFLAKPDTVYELSIHPYGCRVIQRVLEHCSEEQKRPVLESLHLNLRRLVIDQYGNYVVQHVVEHGSENDKDRIVNEILGDVLFFAKHKFASNVIEKCLTNAGLHHKNKLIAEVCGSTNDDDSVFSTPSSPPLLEMMKDQYANYVVQKMLDVADSQHRRKIMYAIRPHINTLRKYSYGKHIITKLEKYFQKQSNNGNMLQSTQLHNMSYDHLNHPALMSQHPPPHAY